MAAVAIDEARWRKDMDKKTPTFKQVVAIMKPVRKVLGKAVAGGEDG